MRPVRPEVVGSYFEVVGHCLCVYEKLCRVMKVVELSVVVVDSTTYEYKRSNEPTEDLEESIFLKRVYLSRKGLSF